ncbi:LYST-interacting protein 5-like protein [Zea mays]|uniref:LYST-interacting protein 5-like protein n=1 Tax=Zea mays TaxID=4577 RepID=A0A1D6NZK9_MAIZE|nr:LYST-interacting protein 5-like protein [Zea mays]
MIIPLPSHPILPHHPHSPSTLLHHNLIPLPHTRQQITLLLIFTNHPPIIHLPPTQAQTTLPMSSTNHLPIIPHLLTPGQITLLMMATILTAMINRMFRLTLRHTNPHPTQLTLSTSLKTTTPPKPQLLHTTTLIFSHIQVFRTARHLLSRLSRRINLHSILQLMVLQLLRTLLLQIPLPQHITTQLLTIHLKLLLQLRHQLANINMIAVTSLKLRRLLRLTRQPGLRSVLLHLTTYLLPWIT